MSKKYPKKVLIIGMMTDIIFHFFWLFVPAILLLIIGIGNDICLFLGIALLVLDVFLSFMEQIKIRQAMLDEHQNPQLQAFREALSKEGNWMNHAKELIDSETESKQ